MSSSSTTDTGMAGKARWLCLTGVAFVIVVLAGFSALGADTPGEKASAADITSFYNAHQASQTATAFVLAAAAPLVVIFGICLALAFWPSESGARPLWQFVLIGGSICTGVAFGISALFHLATVIGADTDGFSGGAMQAFNALDAHNWVMITAGLGVFMLGAAGVLIPRSGAFRTLGWIALVAGIAFYIPFSNFFALVVSGLWFITASVLLFRAQGEPVFAGTPELA
jgi:hypothetical protein